MLSGMVYIYLFGSHVGWGPYLHRILDNNSRMQQLSAEQRDQIFNMQLRIATVGGAAQAAIGTVIVLLIGSGIAMGIVQGLLGVPIRFKQVFSVFCYGFLPNVIARLLSIPVLYVKNPEDIDPQNPFLSNLGAVMDPDKSSKFLYSLATSLDVFSIWVILLIAVGLKAAGGKRLSFGGALFAVVLPWACWVLIRGALASLGMMG
jgi:hypothetical protein